MILDANGRPFRQPFGTMPDWLSREIRDSLARTAGHHRISALRESVPGIKAPVLGSTIYVRLPKPYHP